MIEMLCTVYQIYVFTLGFCSLNLEDVLLQIFYHNLVVCIFLELIL